MITSGPGFAAHASFLHHTVSTSYFYFNMYISKVLTDRGMNK